MPQQSEKNHLADQKSLYLRMHADNPIDWYPWGDEALRRSVEEDKPIFLSIGYSSCHWCHVMEGEVFQNELIAQFMNENFICIKVDREERPDLDNIYMKAVQAMTGSGGWPMSVFLTPDLVPFYGATYIPPEQFITLTEKLVDGWVNRRDEITSFASKIKDALSAQPSSGSANGMSLEEIDSHAMALTGVFDNRWGGTGSNMKFPSPPIWDFILHHYRKTGNEALGDMVRKTLDNMGSGGIHDHLAGGFHRYSVDPMWLVPHFEKMLYDNAQLAGLYTEASVVFDNPYYAQVARSTLDFMAREMRGENGEFYSSFDADSGGVEGSYYVWTPEEINSIAGADDGPVISALLGVSREGNFDGANVLTFRSDLKAVADRLNRNIPDLLALYKKWQPVLLEERSKRTAPTLDKKVVTSWNGLAISAFARAGLVFNEKRYSDIAEHAADFLWRHHRQENGRYYRASNDGVAINAGIIDDYAFVACAAADIFQATSDPDYLQWAIDLVKFADDNFSNPDGGYFQTEKSDPIPIGRQIEFYDGVIPSGNAAMLQALIKVSTLTSNREMRSRAEQIVGFYTHLARRAGIGMATFLDAAEKLNGPFYEVVIAGNRGNPGSNLLLDAYRRIYPSNSILIKIPQDGPSAELQALSPSTSGRIAINGNPTAYVCQFGSCRMPTSDPSVLRELLIDGWSK